MIEKYLVKKITEPVDWKVTVPGSKSMTNRALLMAVLSAGTVRVEGVLFSDDSRHFLACLVALGFTVEIEEEKKCVTVTGCGGRIPREEAVIDVGSAGTAARFLAAMLGFSDGCYEIRCSAQMTARLRRVWNRQPCAAHRYPRFHCRNTACPQCRLPKVCELRRGRNAPRMKGKECPEVQAPYPRRPEEPWRFG